VWLVELAALADPALVPQTVASALGIKEEAGRSLTQTLVDYLTPRHLLLVLDNCEHLLDACARLADTFLRGCPKMRVLATSREGLGIAGELTYIVPSLSLPDPKRDNTPELLSPFEAVRLFIERAQFHQPQFAVTNQNAPALASVCHRLDGIPLAIELAAARVRAMPVEQIEQRLDQRFRLLTGGSRTALPRHQTLRSLIDWSYDLLNEGEKALLCRLSVFAGGWTLEAAEQVCAGGAVEEWEVLDLLTSLADKSLVVYQEECGSARYRLLETVRQYARDRLLDSAEGATCRDRHLAHFVAVAEEAEPNLRGAEQKVWLDRLEAKHDNLRSALEWGATTAPDAALHLAAALVTFWYRRSHLSEARTQLQRAVLHPDVEQKTVVRAKALGDAAAFAALRRDFAEARRWAEEGLEIAEEMKVPHLIAMLLSDVGRVADMQGDYLLGREFYERSLAAYREMEDLRGIATTLGNLGQIHRCLRDLSEAERYYEESLALARQMQDDLYVGWALGSLGHTKLRQGDRRKADEFFRESLAISQSLGITFQVLESVEAVGFLAAAQGQWQRAVRLWGATGAQKAAIGADPEPYEQEDYQRDLSAARAALGENTFDATWQEGRAMTLEQAIELALEEHSREPGGCGSGET
jgi:non-specific serine/threonine protein kinase